MKEVRPLSLAEVNIDLLEVVASVVTRNTREVDAEKNLPVKNRQLVVCVELMDLAEVVAMLHLPGFALHVFADDRIH